MIGGSGSAPVVVGDTLLTLPALPVPAEAGGSGCLNGGDAVTALNGRDVGRDVLGCIS